MFRLWSFCMKIVFLSMHKHFLLQERKLFRQDFHEIMMVLDAFGGSKYAEQKFAAERLLKRARRLARPLDCVQ